MKHLDGKGRKEKTYHVRGRYLQMILREQNTHKKAPNFRVSDGGDDDDDNGDTTFMRCIGKKTNVMESLSQVIQ